MAVQTRFIWFDAHVLAEAERLSRQRGQSLSEFVNAAVERHLKSVRGQMLIAEASRAGHSAGA